MNHGKVHLETPHVHISIDYTYTNAYEDRAQSGRLPPEQLGRVSLMRAELGDGCLPNIETNIRGTKSPFTSPSAYSTGIERNKAVAFARTTNGSLVTDDKGIRNALLEGRTIPQIVEKSKLSVEALTTSGNTALNKGSLAMVNNCLFYNAADEALIAGGAFFSSLIVRTNGQTNIDDVKFVQNGHNWSVVNKGGIPLAEVHAVISGQSLVRDGVPRDPYSDEALADSYADIRQLVAGAYLAHGGPDGKREMRDFGLAQLVSNAQDRSAAVTGRIVELPFDSDDPDGSRWSVQVDELKAALVAKSYDALTSLDELQRAVVCGRRGVFWIDDEKRMAHVVYGKSPYPHHLVALRDDEPGVLYEMVVSGWSNNAGVNPQSIAADVAAAGFSSSLLLDNGGDAILLRKGDGAWSDPSLPTVFAPSSLKREQWAAVILYPESKVGAYEFCQSTLPRR